MAQVLLTGGAPDSIVTIPGTGGTSYRVGPGGEVWAFDQHVAALTARGFSAPEVQVTLTGPEPETDDSSALPEELADTTDAGLQDGSGEPVQVPNAKPEAPIREGSDATGGFATTG